MFDQIHLHRHDRGPSHVSVTKTEVRAPTDASVRLLREMEEAARAKVLEAVRLENTLIDGVLHHMEDHMSGVIQFACVFKINGETLEARFNAKRSESREAIAVGIRDAIAKVIVNKITASVLASSKTLVLHGPSHRITEQES